MRLCSFHLKGVPASNGSYGYNSTGTTVLSTITNIQHSQAPTSSAKSAKSAQLSPSRRVSKSSPWWPPWDRLFWLGLLVASWRERCRRRLQRQTNSQACELLDCFISGSSTRTHCVFSASSASTLSWPSRWLCLVFFLCLQSHDPPSLQPTPGSSSCSSVSVSPPVANMIGCLLISYAFPFSIGARTTPFWLWLTSGFLPVAHRSHRLDSPRLRDVLAAVAISLSKCLAQGSLPISTNYASRVPPAAVAFMGEHSSEAAARPTNGVELTSCW